MLALSVIALILSVVSCVLATVAYLRAGGRERLEQLRRELESEATALRARQQALMDDLASRAHGLYQDLAAQAERAQARLAELREHSSTELRQRIDRLNEQLAELKKKAESGLVELKTDFSAKAEAARQQLRRRVGELEAHVQLLLAKGEIARAERLADKGEFADAEVLLEDAIAKARESKVRLADDVEDEPYLNEVISELQKAIQSVRSRAEDYRRQIDRVVAASDTLLGSLERRERATA